MYTLNKIKNLFYGGNMFGKKIEEIIKVKGIKSKDLAIAANVTEGYLTDIKKGRALPREDKLIRIIDALELEEREKEELYFLWEKGMSPQNFVERFEELERENNQLKSLINQKEKINIDSIRNEYENKIKKLEDEKKDLEKYKTLLFLLPREDRVFFVKKILKDIENNLKITGKTRVLGRELIEIKEILKDI